MSDGGKSGNAGAAAASVGGEMNRWSVGRAPWWDAASGARKKPLLIGVTGGTASGKTTVVRKVLEILKVRWVACLSMDSFYRPLTPEERANVKDYNFDHPSAFDWDSTLSVLEKVKSGAQAEVPVYCFSTHSRLDTTETLWGADVVIFEGIFVLYDARVREMLDMKVFVETDDDLRLIRRIRRDIAERGRSLESVLDQYQTTVKPSFDEFIAPTKRYADLIIPRGGDNVVAIQLLAEHVRARLQKRGAEFAVSMSQEIDRIADHPHPHHHHHNNNSSSSSSGSSLKDELQRTFVKQLPPGVSVLPQNNSVVALQTVLRDAQTDTEEFVFHTDRFCQMVLAETLHHLPYRALTVQTPTDTPFVGVDLDPSRICAVSIVRGGDALKNQLLEMMPESVVGEIIIAQSGSDKAIGPRLYYCKLPKNVHKTTVIVMDAVISTGNNVVMALQALKDHHVQQRNIVLSCLIASPQGLRVIKRSFPDIRIVCGAIDAGLDGNMFSSPGLGAFGDRYFGTDDYEFEAKSEESSAPSTSSGGNGVPAQSPTSLTRRQSSSAFDLSTQLPEIEAPVIGNLRPRNDNNDQ